jgi:hypothetical protein
VTIRDDCDRRNGGGEEVIRSDYAVEHIRGF